MLVHHFETMRGTHYEVDEATGCWNWVRPLTNQGYPFNYAHRRFWEKANGPRPEGFHIHHKCRNRACVNPDHLEAISQARHLEEHALGDRKGLTLDDYRRIRELIAECELTYEKIGAIYGLDLETVYDVARAKHWPELGGPVVLVDRSCGFCGKALPGKRRRDMKFCSPNCRTRFNHKPEYTARANAKRRAARKAAR